MAESKGTAEVESPTIDPVVAPHALDVDESVIADVDDQVEEGGDADPLASDEGDAETGSDETDDEAERKPPEPPRRRLVAELLEGQDIVEEPAASGVQLVAPPLHLEPVDAGQPIYQLDLSSEEPQGILVEPEPYAFPRDSFLDEAASVAAQGAMSGGEKGALQLIKQMIVHRDRRVMAAERDGIGAYELAVGLDEFVRALVDAIRRVDK